MNVVNVVPTRPIRLPTPMPPAPHKPVLVQELTQAIAPVSSGTYVDATLGAGGHSEALLEAGAGKLVGLDRDQVALRVGGKRLEPFAERVELCHARFSQLRDELDRLGIERVDGLVADLGVSSMQLDSARRGMSFRWEGPLDMRMDASGGETAHELIGRSSDDELSEIILKLGDERRAKRISRCVKQAYEAGELSTTHDLRRAVVRAVGPARTGGIDPATRTFQALRIAVNQELLELQALMQQAARCLTAGGVLAVISFHSLEDRLVKRTLREAEAWQPARRKPITPSEAEIFENPRSRSAKMRVATLLVEDAE